MRDVNKQRDEHGLNYARKEIILNGMALNTSAELELFQLSPQLPEIVKKYKEVLDASSLHERKVSCLSFLFCRHFDKRLGFHQSCTNN